MSDYLFILLYISILYYIFLKLNTVHGDFCFATFYYLQCLRNSLFIYIFRKYIIHSSDVFPLFLDAAVGFSSFSVYQLN